MPDSQLVYPLRKIVDRQRYWVNNFKGSGFDLTLECGHTCHIKASQEPIERKRCIQCPKIKRQTDGKGGCIKMKQCDVKEVMNRITRTGGKV